MKKTNNTLPSKYDKTILKVLLYSVVPLLVFNTIKLVNKFSKSATCKIENIKQFENAMRAEYPKLRFEYFNDKYIFFQTDTTLLEKTYLIRDLNKIIEVDASNSP